MNKKIMLIMGIILFIVILIVFSFILNNYNKKKIKQDQINNEEGKKVEIVKVTESNFNSEVLESKKTVLIDFYADWCGPCKMLSPIVQEVANENENIKVVKINIDDEQNLAIKYDIMSIPTLVVIKDGEEKNRVVGVVGKNAILDMLK